MPALQTQGFPVTVMPRAPDFPSQLGKVMAVDPDAVYQSVKEGLDTANATTDNQQAQATLAAQQQQAQATAQASTALLASSVPAQQAQLAAQQQQALLAQGVQPAQAALATAQASRAASLVGPEVSAGGFTRNPDGTFTLTNSTTANGNPVSSSTNQTPFIGTPTDLQKNLAGIADPNQRQDALDVALGLKARASSTPYQPVTTVDSTGARRSLLLNRQTGEVIDNATGQVISSAGLPQGMSVIDPNAVSPPAGAPASGAPSASTAPSLASPFVGPSTAQAAAQKSLATADAQEISDYPGEQQKLATAANEFAAEQQTIQDAKKLAANYSGPDFFRSVAAQIPGNDSYELATKLSSIQGASGARALSTVKNVRSLPEYNGLTQSVGSLALAQNPADLIAALNNYASASSTFYNAAKTAVDTRHAQALQRLGQPANGLGSGPPQGAAPAGGPVSVTPDILAYARAHPELPQSAAILSANPGQ